MKLTNFTFFKDTPFTDFQNTILFPSLYARDSFFLDGEHYDSIEFRDIPFNFIRDRQEVVINVSYEEMRGINYCTFISDFEPDIRYYAYVINYEYVNDNAVRIYLLIDGIMTHCQGYTINNFKNLKVERKHLSRTEYNDRIVQLKNNDDILKTYTKKYTNKDEYVFDSFLMLIQSSSDLTGKFGNVNNPIFETSTGLEFDNVSSPLDLYVVEQEKFNEFMKAMSPYPWITQNFRSILMLPSILLEGQYTKASMETTDFEHLYTLKDKGKTNKVKFDTDLLDVGKTTEELYDIFGLDPLEDKHLLRNEYTTSEVYTWDGQQLFIDNGQLDDAMGILFKSAYVSGFHNEVGIHILGYKGADKDNGSFLNDAIYFRNFDDIPMMVDNYNLSLAKSANQRALSESKLITNRVTDLVSGNGSAEDKFYNAAALASNLNPINLFGKFNDEYDFYRQQKAEMADLALTTPTITSQSNHNLLAIAEGFFGIHLKHAQPSKGEWNAIKKYYKLYGFEINEEASQVDIHTNTICNYVKFSGNLFIPNIDVSIAEMLKAQFENGVRFWHNNGTKNPMIQDVLLNKMR